MTHLPEQETSENLEIELDATIRSAKRGNTSGLGLRINIASQTIQNKRNCVIWHNDILF